jgi:AraC family transcriptional regulator of adaptative response/methylated-DNA-[protein]-cysteine methyltransferase
VRPGAALPGFDEMYTALVERDPAFDGVFVACVRTTGVFCRPTCRARAPRRENVEFLGRAEAALDAGYRPCRACRPLEVPATHPAWVRAVIAEARAGDARLTDARLRESGVDPGRARRYFRKHFGATFQAFQRSVRLGAALRRLSGGQDGLDAGLESGYESSSGFRAAFRGQFGLAPGRSRRMGWLVAGELQTPLRPMIAVASERGVVLLEFLDRRGLHTELRRLRSRFAAPVMHDSSPHLERLRTELAEYFAGARRRFDVPLDACGTPFQRGVWDRLRRIPFGRTVSYAHLATAMGNPRAVRAVGRANAQNPIAIVIPCHRVVRADGSLCGYGGGLWRKRWLLEHERGSGPARDAGAR